MANILATLAVLAASVHAAVDVSGSGHIIVLNHTEPIPTLENRIGCLDMQGHLVVDDCGIFSNLEDAPESDSGFGCDWSDEIQPENLDSAYGKNSFGYSCWEGADPFVFYPVYEDIPFLCYGRVNCAFDVPKAPEGDERLPVWEYIWGSQQIGITPGHLRAWFYWEKKLEKL